jgi:hypothetical protein
MLWTFTNSAARGYNPRLMYRTWKNKETSNLYKCVWTVCNKIWNAEIKGDKYFVDEVETQLREKPLRGSQTQDIHYSEDKAS